MVHDLYVLMITAGIVSLLFKLLKQPVVLGYIVAGVLVGPNLFGDNWVDPENVEAWGNIGVLFDHRGIECADQCVRCKG